MHTKYGLFSACVRMQVLVFWLLSSLVVFVQHNSFSKRTRICQCGEVARAVCIGGRWF